MSNSLPRRLSTLTKLLITWPYVSLQITTQTQCNFIIQSKFENCTSENRRFSKVHPPHACKNNTVCEREFALSFVRIMPYYDRKTLVEDMIKYCCGKCAKLKTVNIFRDAEKVNMSSLATSDFLYPFLAERNTHMRHGFYFIPMIDTPGVYYITRKTVSPKETLLTLVKACASLWPVFTLCILMAMVSGFLMWYIETWNNPKEFSRQFVFGLFDGFWWAFVSMTTVGYGDKIPRSWMGRVVSIGWILIGISICSVLTAALTNVVIATIRNDVPEMRGQKVGFLKHRLYEATIIAQYGGKITGIEAEDYESGITRLLVMLADHQIEGILLDKLVYNLFMLTYENKSRVLYSESIENQLSREIVITEIFSKRSSALSYGLLVRNYQDNVYFRRYITDNKVHVSACNSLRLNSHIHHKDSRLAEVYLFTLEAGLFWTSFAVCVGVLLGIMGFGLLYENTRLIANCYQRMKRKKTILEEDWKVKYCHTEYKQYWIDVRDAKKAVIGNTVGRQKAVPLTERQFNNELSKQNVNVIFLDNIDVIIISDA